MQRSIFVWCVVFMLGVAGGGRAQLETPTPTPTPQATPSAQYITAFQAAVYFPMAVRFSFDAILPRNTAITTATLVLESDSLGTVARNLPIEDERVLQQAGVLVDLSYFWTFEDLNETPAVFEEVTYTWNLTLSGGQQDSAQGTLTFVDQRVRWQTVERESIPLVLTLPFTMDGERLLERLRPLVVRLAAEAREIPAAVPIVLYTGAPPLECPRAGGQLVVANPADGEQTVPCAPNRAAALYERDGYVVLDLPSDGLGTAQAALSPLLVERAYAPFWEDANIPAWFVFGLKTLYADETTKGRLAFPALNAARSGLLFSLEGLADDVPPVDDLTRRATWEGQSYGLVVYMAERYGLDPVFELARSVNADDPFAMVFADVTGDTLADLLVAWEVWIFTDDAPNVYGVNLYVGETATPTFTPSVTPVTPSRTPFPTFTPTDTPTITPTRLPPTPTPTVTPRPARDVFTPTPTPTPVPPPTALLPVDPQVAQWVLLGVGVLAVALVLGGLLAGGRRR